MVRIILFICIATNCFSQSYENKILGVGSGFLNFKVPTSPLLYSSGAIQGTTWLDNSGKENDLNILTQCPNFDNGYLRYDSTVARVEGAMTISAYIKGQSSQTAEPGGIGRYYGTFYDRADYYLAIDNSGEVEFRIASDFETMVGVTYNLGNADSSIWHHVMATYSPSNYLRIFVDGVQVAENTTSIPASQYTCDTNFFHIGAQGNGGSNFFGQMADVRVYDTVRTYSEIIAKDTNNIVFWDGLQSYIHTDGSGSFINGKSYAFTGEVGTKLEFYISHDYQDQVRFGEFGFTKVMAGDTVRYIPYDLEGNSQYADFSPIINAGETIEEIPYVSDKLNDCGEKYYFSYNGELDTYDRFGLFSRPNNTKANITFRMLCNDLLDYYDVDTTYNYVNSITFTKGTQLPTSINYYVLWGQSNMVGTGDTTLNDTLLGNLDMLIYSNGIDTLNVEQQNNQFGEQADGYFGMELSFALRKPTLQGGYISGVKYAVGNTGLAQNAGWNYGTTFDNLYDTLKVVYDEMRYELMLLGYNPITIGIIQAQGENDAIQESNSLTYADNLSGWYSDFNAFIGATPNTYIVNIADTDHTYVDNVRTAISDYGTANDHVYIIEGRDFSNDGLHHYAIGYINLGSFIGNLVHSTENP